MSEFKAIRERLGATQQEMADALGCSQGNVSLMDKGQTVLPEMAKKLIAFAATRGHSITYEDIYGPALDKPGRKTSPSPQAAPARDRSKSHRDGPNKLSAGKPSNGKGR